MNNRDIRTVDDVLRLLDGLFAPDADRWTEGGSDWWDGFYADRDKPVPFFVTKPDESLVSYVERGLLPTADAASPGTPTTRRRALDLGCGPGRNTLYLASLGYEVDAVDLSPTAIGWAGERAREAGATGVRFVRGDAFTSAALDGPYDLIHDSGCFHHLPPHRRVSYLALLERVLAPGGHLSMTAFAAGDGGMGSEVPDAELYRRGSLEGGLAYTDASLRALFADLTEIEVRRMRDEPADSPAFGESFLWTALFRRA
ncbi:SAM-dependent methyltransferase [Streptomyces sp. Root66D1]|nr:SAM-dependent methyltransferase [Streptomyces sp. Root1304]KRB00945.1 SAM-dependent methyltransferase [Streptomyces sp. Root66D1]